MKLRSWYAIFAKMADSAIRLGLLYGLVCGIIGGFPIFGIGALFGMPMGAVAGFASGIASSFLLSTTSLLMFSPLRKDRHLQYRVVAALVCLIVPTIVGSIVFQAIFHPINDMSGYIVPFIVIPSLLAALRCSQVLATIYIEFATSNQTADVT